MFRTEFRPELRNLAHLLSLWLNMLPEERLK